MNRVYMIVLATFFVLLYTGLGTARANRWSVEIDGKMRAMGAQAMTVKVGAVECKIGASVVRSGVASRTLSCTYQGTQVAHFVQTCGVARDVRIKAGNVTHRVDMSCRIPPRRFR